MTTFAASQRGGEPGSTAGDAVIGRPSRRAKTEALGLLLGMLGILFGLALTVGAPLPFGP
jgi:hypothetical protein